MFSYEPIEIKEQCPCGKEEITPEYIPTYHRSLDLSVPDEELDVPEMYERLNGEAYRTYKCPKCDLTWEEL